MPTLTIKADKPMALISVEEYEEMSETIDLLTDPYLANDIEEARKALREGRTVTWEEFKKDFLK